MPIRVRCSQCETVNSLADTMSGKKIRCKKCQSVIAVPEAEIEEDAAPAAIKGKGSQAKTRSAPVEDQEEERPRGKDQRKQVEADKSSSKLVLLLGSVGAFLLLVGVVVAALVIMKPWSDPKAALNKPELPIGGKGGKPSDKKPPVEEKEEIPTGSVELTGEQLGKEFTGDWAAAIKKYGNREITLISFVERFPGQKFVVGDSLVLRGYPDKNGFMRGISCILAAKDKERLNDMVWGQSVKVRGKLNSAGSAWLYAQLAGCELVEIGKPSAAIASFTIEQMRKELVADRKSLMQKYLGKGVEISGTVFDSGYDGPGNCVAVSLFWQDPDQKIHVVRCNIRGKDENAAHQLSRGQVIKVFGQFTDGPGISDGHLVEVGEDPALVVTSVEFTKELAADKDAAVKKYDGKPVRCEGVIASLKKEDYGWRLQLAGFNEEKAKPPRVEAFVSGGGHQQHIDRLATLKVGQTIVVRGSMSIQDRTLLAGAALQRIKE